jgi:hypothetical protein
VLNILQGKKTYLAALGLVGLAVYQFSVGNVPGGIQSLLGAAAAFGLRDAQAQQEIRVMQGVQAVREAQSVQSAMLSQAYRPLAPAPAPGSAPTILRSTDH